MLNRFYNCAREQYNHFIKQNQKKILHLVVGNQSCDLDSFASTVVLAWHKQEVEGSNSHIFMPLLGIRRAAMKLRTEITFVMNKNNIVDENILFLDEVDLEKLSQFDQTALQITLVDHHVLTRELECLYDNVVEIVDHRPVDAEIRSDIKQEIHIVGSCSTLVAERILKSSNPASLPDQVKELLLSAIIVDTFCFSPAMGKTTARDEKVFQQMWGKKSKGDIDCYYKNLTEAKFSVDGLSNVEMMLKDPKHLSNSKHQFLFSTLHQDLYHFFERPNVTSDVIAHCSESNLTVWIAIAPVVEKHPIHYKPLALYSPNNAIRDQIISRLTESEHDIKIANEPIASAETFVFLRIHNCKASRKQILPIVAKVLANL